MYSNILVPISLDASRNAEMALKAAQVLAAEGGTITVLNVMQTVPVYVSDHLPLGILENNRAEREAELAQLIAPFAGVKAHVVDGQPGDRILSWARDHGCDCIVVASHEPAMSDYLLGSTAQMIVRHAKSAVHVIR